MDTNKFETGFTFKNSMGETYIVNVFVERFNEYECCHEQCVDVKFYTHEQILNFIK